MHSIRRAATRATLHSSVSVAAAAPKSQTISSALRAFNAAAVASRYFSVAAPRAFSRSVAFRDEQQTTQQEFQQEGSRQPREEPSEHCLFVQNYSFDVKPDEMSEAFSKYGEVVAVSMPPNKTFCFIYYKDAEAVITAAENVDGTFWHGRRIVAKASEARQPSARRGEGRERRPARSRGSYDGPPTNTVYVGNIAFESSDAELSDIFASLHNVRDVRVAVDRATGWPRGFAHADFDTVEDATAAIEKMKGVKLRDRELVVSYAPPSNKNRDGNRSDRSPRGPRGPRGPRESRGPREPREPREHREYRARDSQRQVEERVEAEHEQAEAAQKEQKPEAGKQDMNWNA